MLTTKSADYTSKGVVKRSSFKPDLSAQRKKELPQFEGQTTSGTEYKAYEGWERQPMFCEPPTNLTVNQDKFEGESTAKQSYPVYRYSAGSRVKPIIPPERAHVAGQEFYGVTTNSSCYRGVTGAGPPRPIIYPPAYLPPPGEMSTETTTKSHFNIKRGQRAQLFIPQNIREAPAAFSGNTTNKDTYLLHPVQNRPKPKEKDKYNPPTEKFCCNSVHREIYKPFSVQRRRKLSPLNAPRSAPVPKFEGTTTHRDQFKQWKVSRQKGYYEPPPLLRLNSGTMQTQSMQQSDFVYDKNKVERVMPIIPALKVVKSEQPIDTLTSYKNEFRGLQNKCRLAEILMQNSEQKLKA